MTNPITALISETNTTAANTTAIKGVHSPTELQSKLNVTTVIVSTMSMSVRNSRKIR